jgi:hypothetical protein
MPFPAQLFSDEAQVGKDARMTMRLTPGDYDRLRRVARAFGMEPSRFARRLILLGLQAAEGGALKEGHTNHV